MPSIGRSTLVDPARSGAVAANSTSDGVVPRYTMQKQQLQTRLRRIEGQVRGVARMIDVRDEIKAGGGEAKVDELLEVMDRVLRR